MDEAWKDSNALHTLYSIPQLLLNMCTETLCHSTLLISIIVLQLQFVCRNILWGARKKLNPLLHLVSCSSCRSSLQVPILEIALVRILLAFLVGISVPSDSSGSSASLTSIGYNFVIGLLVIPVEVRMLTAHTSPSLPTINSSITANLQHALGMSLWIITMSPFFTACWLFVVK